MHITAIRRAQWHTFGIAEHTASVEVIANNQHAHTGARLLIPTVAVVADSLTTRMLLLVREMILREGGAPSLYFSPRAESGMRTASVVFSVSRCTKEDREKLGKPLPKCEHVDTISSHPQDSFVWVVGSPVPSFVCEEFYDRAAHARQALLFIRESSVGTHPGAVLHIKRVSFGEPLSPLYQYRGSCA